MAGDYWRERHRANVATGKIERKPRNGWVRHRVTLTRLDYDGQRALQVIELARFNAMRFLQVQGACERIYGRGGLVIVLRVETERVVGV